MFERYTLSQSDNLESIAKRFNTNVEYLKSINNLFYTDNLREGLEIIVPAQKELYYDYLRIDEGATLLEICQKYNINPELLAVLNGLDLDDYMYAGDEILLPKSNYSYYITKDGDTIDTVAGIFSLGKNDILKENNTIYLMAGQLIGHKKK